MSASPRLPRHLRAALGADAGEELVTIIDEIRSERGERMARMEAQLNEWRRESDEWRRDVEEWKRDTATRFDRIDERLQRIEAKVSDVKSDLMKWSFVFWCGAVASVAALARALR